MESNSREGLPELDFTCLASYEWVSIPAWVYDPHEYRHWWANDAGLQFWRSPSVEDLCTRSYADSSVASKARIQLAMEAHARGETTCERWTLYPRDVPSSIVLQGTAIRLPSGHVGVLYMAELAMQVEPNVIRAIEALQHATVLVAIHDQANGQVLFRNTAAAMAFDTSAPGNAFANMFFDASLSPHVLARVVGGETFAADIKLQTINGPVWHRFEARPARDPVTGNPAVQVNATDISRLLEMQQALSAAQLRAEAASASKSQFLRNTSHELMTPINGMLPVLHMLARGPLEVRQQRWVDVVLKSTQALTVVLSDILELARLDHHGDTPQPVVFDPRRELAAAILPFSVEADRKGIKFSWAFDPGVKALVIGDARRIRQVVLNLVANAVKFTERGEVRVSFAEITHPGAKDHLCLRVSDTGIGISEADLATIHQPFSQVDGTMTRKQGGCGIGLTIVHRVLEILEGTISVKSQPGIGSEFSVSIPVESAESASR